MNNFDDASLLLPERMSVLLRQLPAQMKNQVTELRVRRNKPLVVMLGSLACFLTDAGKLINHCSPHCLSVEAEAFEAVFAKVCAFSVHTHMGTLIDGYVTAENGNRIGVAASAVIKNGEICSIKDATSLNIRIAKNVTDCARGVLNALYIHAFPSIIVAAPPGGGKTTFLRDFARLLSGGFGGSYKKITVIDERSEIAAFDLGVNTDIINGFPKKKGIEIAVRTLSPDMIVCDEIADDEEVDMIKSGFSSGVSFAVSVHVKNMQDIAQKSIMKKLILTGEFDYAVLLEDYADSFTVVDLRSCNNEDPWTVHDSRFLGADGFFDER